MAKQTKTLKQAGLTDVKINIKTFDLVLTQDKDMILIERSSLPELIELLKSEIGGSNG
jgi:hypothetical protein